MVIEYIHKTHTSIFVRENNKILSGYQIAPKSSLSILFPKYTYL